MGFKRFEGRDVTESGIEMPGAGGGFHASLEVDELELEHGDEVTIATKVRVTKVRFDLVDKDADDGPLRRVHVFRVLGAAQIPEESVRAALEDQARRVEEAKGIDQLPYSDGDEPEEDDGGLCPHDRPRDECTVCPAQPAAEPEPEPELED